MAEIKAENRENSHKNLTFFFSCYILGHCAAKLTVNTGFAAAALPFAAKYALTKAGLAIGPKAFGTNRRLLGRHMLLAAANRVI